MGEFKRMNEGMAAVEAKVFLTRPASVLIAFGSEGTSDIPIGGARKSGARLSGGRPAVQQRGNALFVSRRQCQAVPYR